MQDIVVNEIEAECVISKEICKFFQWSAKQPGLISPEEQKDSGRVENGGKGIVALQDRRGFICGSRKKPGASEMDEKA